jgi:hypothetical protein
MAFSNFKSIADVQEKYPIKYSESIFITSQPVELSDHFIQDFKFYQENIDIFTSEASRSEIIISPLLREIYKKYYTKYSFWIQKSISYDEILSGTPDYIIAIRSPLGKTFLEKPILIVVEAKKNDFEQGWGQCLAELIAAQKLNKDYLHPVHGIVTDGNLWQFGKLEKELFVKNLENYTIDKLSCLYGALNYIMENLSK